MSDDIFWADLKRHLIEGLCASVRNDQDKMKARLPMAISPRSSTPSLSSGKNLRDLEKE